MDAEMLKAIGGLWPLALTVVVFILCLVFRKQVAGRLESLIKLQVKEGRAEFSPEPATKEESKPELSKTSIGSEEKQTLMMDSKTELEPSTSREWLDKMIAAFLERNEEQVEKAFTKMQECESQSLKKLQNEANYYWLKYQLGDTSALKSLQDMAQQKGLDKAVLWRANRFIGHCYKTVDDFAKAADAYETAAQLCETEDDRAVNIVDNAICLYKSNKKQEALTKLMNQTKIMTKPGALSIIYEGLASIYELTKEPELRAIALEKALEINPNDTQLLFKAAYSYSQKELTDLAFLHYKTSLEFKPDDGGALNNIGILYADKEMPIHSIKAYKKAAELNSSLAAANLASIYLDAGLKEEASQILDKAKEQKEIHPNVGKVTSSIASREKAELEIEESSINAAHEQQKFIREFGEAYFKGRPGNPEFSGRWKLPDERGMEFKQTETTLESVWSSNKDKYKYEGEINNWAVKLTVYQEKYTWAGQPKLEFSKVGTGYGYLTSEGQLNIMIVEDDKEEYFLNFNRQT